MASVFRRNGARKGKWLAKFLNADGQYETLSTGTTDHAAAERIADKWEADAVLRREGAIDASIEKLARQARRPIAEHLNTRSASWTSSMFGSTAAMIVGHSPPTNSGHCFGRLRMEASPLA